MITPAISVLGAVEGIGVAAPAAPGRGWCRHLSSLILVALFMFQRRGTARVGAVFGRVMVVWFTPIALLGVQRDRCATRRCCAAVNPWHAIRFFLRDGLRGFLILGAVVLVVTGGEALYADMGHFGKRPIRLAWFAVVLPALVLNYFGQGALLLDHPAAARNPFYSLVPGVGAVSDGGGRDGGRGGGVAGADLGGVLAHPPGRAARVLPAGDHPATPRKPRSGRSTSPA